MAEWRLGELADAVSQVISELVTNSATATGKLSWEAGLPPVRLWLLGGSGTGAAGEAMVLVWDAVAEPPVRGEPGAESESGRGLGIVDWFSGGQWGAYRPPAPFGGKVTWALVSGPGRDPG
jgi:hypothetical protein